MRESQIELSDTQSKLLPLQLELHKTKRETELHEATSTDTQQQLESRVAELRKYRDETSSRLHQLENELRNGKEENACLQISLRGSQEYSKIQDDKVDGYLKRIKDLEADHASLISTHTHEMREKDKMVQMCKAHREEAHARAEQLEAKLAGTKEASASQLAQLKVKMQAMIDRTNDKLDSEKTKSDAKIKALSQQLAEAVCHMPVIAQGSAAVLINGTVEFESMGTTAMYNRVVVAERERDEANRKRTEAEIYLQRILKDVETKAPVIAAKQRDLNRVLESNSHLSQRLDEVVNQNQILLEAIEKAECSAQTAIEEAQVLEQANRDLSAQVQHLLKASQEKKTNGAIGAGTRIRASDGPETSVALIEASSEHVSDYLTTFKDVSELQTRNEQLLKVVRKLRLESEKFSVKVQHGAGTRASEVASSSDALKALMNEVKSLREARQLTEQKVLVLIQQNEMYKLMLAESDATMTSKTPGAIIPGPFSSDTSPTTKFRQQDAWALAQSEEEKNRFKEKLIRAQEAEKLLNESLEKVREEAGMLRLDKAQAASEARHHRERASRMEESLKIAQTDSASALQRRLDLEKILLEQQRECRVKEDQVVELQTKLREEQDSRRRAEIDFEINQSYVTRLEKSLADQRNEMKVGDKAPHLLLLLWYHPHIRHFGLFF